MLYWEDTKNDNYFHIFPFTVSLHITILCYLYYLLLTSTYLLLYYHFTV